VIAAARPQMSGLRFRSEIEINNINPYVRVSAEHAARLTRISGHDLSSRISEGVDGKRGVILGSKQCMRDAGQGFGVQRAKRVSNGGNGVRGHVMHWLRLYALLTAHERSIKLVDDCRLREYKNIKRARIDPAVGLLASEFT
jgi:hypothetical protein